MDARTIQFEIADAIIERPHGFEIGGRHFFLYPTTLGKNLLQNAILMRMGISERSVMSNPVREVLNVVKRHRKEVSTIIAIHTLTKKDELLTDILDNRAKEIENEADEKDLTVLFSLVLTKDQKVSEIMKFSGIDKEHQRKEKVMKVKDDKNTFVFGGKTLYGQLIDLACERYGWEMDYVVWGISLANLQLLLADQVSSVFLTDEERKKARISNDREVLNGDDPRNMQRIKELFND